MRRRTVQCSFELLQLGGPGPDSEEALRGNEKSGAPGSSRGPDPEPGEGRRAPTPAVGGRMACLAGRGRGRRGPCMRQGRGTGRGTGRAMPALAPLRHPRLIEIYSKPPLHTPRGDCYRFAMFRKNAKPWTAPEKLLESSASRGHCRRRWERGAGGLASGGRARSLCTGVLCNVTSPRPQRSGPPKQRSLPPSCDDQKCPRTSPTVP